MKKYSQVIDSELYRVLSDKATEFFLTLAEIAFQLDDISAERQFKELAQEVQETGSLTYLEVIEDTLQNISNEIQDIENEYPDDRARVLLDEFTLEFTSNLLNAMSPELWNTYLDLASTFLVGEDFTYVLKYIPLKKLGDFFNKGVQAGKAKAEEYYGKPGNLVDESSNFINSNRIETDALIALDEASSSIPEIKEMSEKDLRDWDEGFLEGFIGVGFDILESLQEDYLVDDFEEPVEGDDKLRFISQQNKLQNNIIEDSIGHLLLDCLNNNGISARSDNNSTMTGFHIKFDVDDPTTGGFGTVDIKVAPPFPTGKKSQSGTPYPPDQRIPFGQDFPSRSQTRDRKRLRVLHKDQNKSLALQDVEILDGKGKGTGMPWGNHRNKNQEPCLEGGPSYGRGEGRGKGKNRQAQTDKFVVENLLTDYINTVFSFGSNSRRVHDLVADLNELGLTISIEDFYNAVESAADDWANIVAFKLRK